MSNPNNPFDNTIWDPDGEHAIEDPFHGPSAVHSMLQIPAMPLGNGTYYQSGAYYTLGTPYLDSKDRPRPVVIGGSVESSMRESNLLVEWIQAFHEGEDSLIALEAARQKKRLEETGSARCYKLSDVCPGGKKLEDCETGSKAYAAAEKWGETNCKERPDTGRISNIISGLGGRCMECTVSCQVAVNTDDGISQETCVTYYRPSPAGRIIQLSPAEMVVRSPEDEISLRDIFSKLGPPETHFSPPGHSS